MTTGSNISMYRQRGAIMIIALIAVLLLAALVFYVFNIGQAANRRVVTQNAADASANAAAGQIARSMNTVAMNNVEISKQIALINVLDAMPLAVDLTVNDDTETPKDDLEALRIAVPAQLRSSVTDAWFRRTLEAMEIEVIDEDVQLQQLDDYFRNNPNDVMNMTFYNAPSGERGSIWQAMKAMSDISVSTMENYRLAAQRAATEVGQSNLPRQGRNAAEAGAIAIVEEMPWEQGVFDDFERPVMDGMLPLSIDDEQYRRGPYDVIFGWRNLDGSSGGPGNIPGPGSPPIMGPPSPATPSTMYRTYGTQSWMIGHVPDRPYHRLRYWVQIISNIKAQYCWNSPWSGDLRTVIDPEWEVDVDRDNERSQDANDESVYEIVADDRSRVRETLYVVAEIKSRIPNDPGSPAMQGRQWNYINRPGVARPFLLRRGGWRDPRNRPPMAIRSSTAVNYRRVNNHIWHASGTYLTNPYSITLGGDPEISLPPKQAGVDPDGNPIYEAQTVYWEIDFMLVGVNVGPEIEVRNPYEGFSPNNGDAPRPVNLVHTLMDHDDHRARQDYLTVFAAAQQDDVSSFWPSRFDNGKPYPHQVGIAQAKVFNNHSWDLWTQMWHAQLEPVTEFDNWASRLSSYPNNAPNQELAAELQTYFEAIAPLADVMLSH